jgi:hypothetical protein
MDYEEFKARFIGQINPVTRMGYTFEEMAEGSGLSLSIVKAFVSRAQKEAEIPIPPGADLSLDQPAEVGRHEALSGAGEVLTLLRSIDKKLDELLDR